MVVGTAQKRREPKPPLTPEPRFLFVHLVHYYSDVSGVSSVSITKVENLGNLNVTAHISDQRVKERLTD